MHRISRTTGTALPALGVAAVLALAGCGGPGDAQDASSDQSATPAASSTASASPAASTTSSTPDAAPRASASGGSASASSSGSRNGAGSAADGAAGGRSASPAQETCSGQTGQQAAEENIGKLPAPSVSGRTKWTTEGVDLRGFDDCAALAAIPVGVESATVSSPYQIMLFRHGKYIGPATQEDYGWAPTITRLADDRIQVTYSYARGQDANAFPSGRATSVFALNDAGMVTRTGELPPVPGQ